jgi:hypothetical protein
LEPFKLANQAIEADDDMPKSRQFLLEQIARARRFANAMNADANRARFEKMAADDEGELADATEAAQEQPSAALTARKDAAPTDNAAAAQLEADSAPPAAASTPDQEPTTD